MNYSNAIAKFDKFRIRYNTDDSFADFLDFELDEEFLLIESLLKEHEISIAKQEIRDNAIVENIAKLDVKSFLVAEIYKSVTIDDDVIEIEKSTKINDMIDKIQDYAFSQLDLVAKLESKQSEIFALTSEQLKKYTTATNIKVISSTIDSRVTLNTHFLRDLIYSFDEMSNDNMIERNYHDIKHSIKKLLQLNMLDNDAIEMLSTLKCNKTEYTFANLSKLDSLTDFLNLLCYSLNKYSYELASRNIFESVIVIDQITFQSSK